ncbi:hypothetical protein OURE66S_03728 [Oligella ureolytica]
MTCWAKLRVDTTVPLSPQALTAPEHSNNSQRICTGWRLNQAVPAIILNTASSSEEEIRAQKQLSPEQIVRAEEIGSTLIALMST